MEVSNLNNTNEIDVHGTVHSKSDDGEVDMMDEDQSLCEKENYFCKFKGRDVHSSLKYLSV